VLDAAPDGVSARHTSLANSLEKLIRADTKLGFHRRPRAVKGELPCQIHPGLDAGAPTRKAEVQARGW